MINLLREAARDPQVLAIKQTLYRTGADSEIVNILAEAARHGKEVTAVIELRARLMKSLILRWLINYKRQVQLSFMVLLVIKPMPK